MRESFSGQRLTQVPRNTDRRHGGEMEMIERHDLDYVYGLWGRGLGQSDIHYGENGGYQAINIAYLRGATRIILLGYDMSRDGDKVHWFGNHPQILHAPLQFEKVAKHFDQLAIDLAEQGVEVVNCTRRTALTCFKQAAIEDI